MHKYQPTLGSTYLKARLQARHPGTSCDRQTQVLLSAITLTSPTKSSVDIKKRALLKIYTTFLLHCTTCFLRWLVKTFHSPLLYLLHTPMFYLFFTLSLLEERAGITWENQSNEIFCLAVINVVCHNPNQMPCFKLLTYQTFTYLIIRHDMCTAEAGEVLTTNQCNFSRAGAWSGERMRSVHYLRRSAGICLWDGILPTYIISTVARPVLMRCNQTAHLLISDQMTTRYQHVLLQIQLTCMEPNVG